MSIDAIRFLPNTCMCGHDYALHGNPTSNQSVCNGCAANANGGGINAQHGFVSIRELNNPGNVVRLVQNPGLPNLTQFAGGALAARTYYVMTTRVLANGTESGPSLEASISLFASNLVRVTGPAALPPWENVTGYKVYASTTSGAEVFQAQVAQGTQWQEPTTGLLTTGASPPTVNSAGIQSTAPFVSADPLDYVVAAEVRPTAKFPVPGSTYIDTGPARPPNGQRGG